MVTSLEFSPDGKILASSGYDHLIKFWDMEGGGLLGQVSIADTPTSLSFSANGNKLAVASSLEVTLVNPLSMQIEQSIPVSSGDHLAVSPDGSLIYLSTPFDITVIDSEAGTVILEFPDPSALVPTLTLAADGSILGVSYETPNTVDNFALSPDGKQILTYTAKPSINSDYGAENIRLAAWDAKTGKYLRETKFAGNLIKTMKLDSEGRLLAFGNGNELWILDTTSWQIVRKFSGHIDLIEDLEFTPDGTKVLSASRDGTIRVWSFKE
jgi:WD40 repeat protein